jgi:recombination protein RecA
MSAAASLRARIEATLANRIPGALSPMPRMVREFVRTGVPRVDELLCGGFPANAITEITGGECSGRTSLALSLITELTQAEKICAWVDVSDALHPESAAATGVNLRKLLWVCCGASAAQKFPSDSKAPVLAESCRKKEFELPKKYFVPRPAKKGLHGGGVGPHPRGEAKGLSNAIPALFRPEESGLPAERRTDRSEIKSPEHESTQLEVPKKGSVSARPWSRLDRGLRVTDLLLQNGGFAAIVLDMGSIVAEHALRVPLETWFRYRSVAEQKRTSLILLLQHPCAKSSAALTLRFHAGSPIESGTTVLAGMEHCLEVERERFSVSTADVAGVRKFPQKQKWTHWPSRTAWTER